MAGAVAIFERAQNLADRDKEEVINMYKEIVRTEDGDGKDAEQIRIKERSILELGQLFSRTGRAVELGNLIKVSEPFLKLISKAKASRLVQTLVDLFLDMEGQTGMELEICEKCIQWAKEEKRMFVRQSLEARYIALLCDTKRYTEALELSSTLLKELKKIEDKTLLVTVNLSESKVYCGLENLPKARTSLTSARIIASTMYCPPKLQAALDLQSGILYAAIEHDFKIAGSYFYEAFEGYDSVHCPKALTALKYMLLSKIMLKVPKEVHSLAMGKTAITYAGSEVDAMKAVAEATHKQSLSDFKSVLSQYKSELHDDPVIKEHLKDMYETMLEQNILRIIEPFSRVQIDYISEVINLPRNVVEEKLSMMILDKMFSGILDQENGVLTVHEDAASCKTFNAVLENIQILGKIVDVLYQKATKLS